MNSRIAVIDQIRGYAILGIIIVNYFYYFNNWVFLDSEVQSSLNENIINSTILGITDLFFDKKFFGLFTVLFGVGIYIQKNLRAYSSKKILIRLLILFIIGLLHLVFVWYGDILIVLSIAGIISYLIIKVVPDKYLLFFALFFIIVLPVFFYIVLPEKAFPYQDLSAILNEYTASNLTNHIRFNIGVYKLQYFGSNLSFLHLTCISIGNMLIGYIVTHKYFFKNLSINYIMISIVIFLSLAFGFNYVMTNIRSFNLSGWRFYALYSSSFISYLSFSLFYILIFVLMNKKNLLSGTFGKVFGQIGKMSLTAYIFHSIFGVALFYFFNLTGELSPLYSLLLSFCVFLILIIFGLVWFSNKEQGPLEKLWRSTYKNL